MMSNAILFLLLIASCELFHQATCPSVRGHKCGLSSHRKSDNTRRTNKQFTKYQDYRRQRMSPYKAPWKVLNPEELWHLRPTKPSSRIYWNRTNERCDYIRLRCLKAYTTGAVCARNIDYLYMSFNSYCAMDFHNCVAKLDDMNYDQMSNNSKLKQMYIADLGDETEFEAYATYAPVESTTVEYEAHNVTDENGIEVTDEEGNFVTHLVPVTKSFLSESHNVTDENGTLVTDKEGNFVTQWVEMTPPFSYELHNVTDENGTEVTDEEGKLATQWVRVTAPHQPQQQHIEVTDGEGNTATP
ncbi:uncharacterized protein LOC133529546 isoform X2 [Cydia pomonella]|uniref:uncharacterized protein LOC133529546 isoform X2 n=1 Tax=Cydia pomonella TaxID=82600 RepID=UPI002ADDB9F7|nr:uncharacterized protein LOC133529546 isoform X2 [Cydia pomonella]